MNKPNVLYLAGPMRGYADYNFPAFMGAAQLLRYLGGYEVVNPAEHDHEIGFNEKTDTPTQEQIAAMMRWDMGSILWVDAVVLLPGWAASEGACMERAVAYYAGKPCYDYTPDQPSLITPQVDYHRPQIFWTKKHGGRLFHCLDCKVPMANPRRGLCDVCHLLFTMTRQEHR